MRALKGPFRTIVGTAVAIAVSVAAADRGPGVSAQASEQSVFVSVLQRSAPVLDLSAEEFVVEEDGQLREVLRVEPASIIPMQIAILVDDSRGVTRTLSHMRNGLSDLIDALPNGQQVAFITFGDEMRTVVDYTRDTARLKTAVTRFVTFSETGSYLPNALVATALDLWRRGAIRPIIILVTTEGTNAATGRLSSGAGLPGGVSPRGFLGLGYDRVLNVLRETRSAVHTLVVRGVGVPTFASGASLSTATRGQVREGMGDRDRAALLEQLPKVTGGGREELGTTSALAELLTRIANEVANQYLVTYARPAGLIPPTKIEVSVTRRRMTVRSTPAHPR